MYILLCEIYMCVSYYFAYGVNSVIIMWNQSGTFGKSEHAHCMNLYGLKGKDNVPI